jgi:hypothetical protein
MYGIYILLAAGFTGYAGALPGIPCGASEHSELANMNIGLRLK